MTTDTPPDGAFAENGCPTPDLGRLVHSVVNSTASISFSANALRGAGQLTDSSLEALTRMEQAATLIAQTVKAFATAARELPRPATDEAAFVNLYDVCCETADQRRGVGGREISCHAFGDSRGRWKRAQITGLVTLMVDTALAHVEGDAHLVLRAKKVCDTGEVPWFIATMTVFVPEKAMRRSASSSPARATASPFTRPRRSTRCSPSTSRQRSRPTAGIAPSLLTSVARFIGTPASPRCRV